VRDGRCWDTIQKAPHKNARQAQLPLVLADLVRFTAWEAGNAECDNCKIELRFAKCGLLNDDSSDHARMDRTREVIRARLVELVGKALVRVHPT
jgi:hypothetical protein